MLRNGGQREAALVALNQGLVLKPNHLNARIERADLEIELKHYEAAKSALALFSVLSDFLTSR